MTDLISSLADSIVALINSKPQSPTKAEVEELLAHWLLAIDHETARYKFPGESPNAKQARQQQWERAVNGPLMPLPYKEPSPELMQLLRLMQDADALASYLGFLGRKP